MMKREMNSFSLFHYIYKNVIIYIDYFSLRSIMELLWRKRIMYKTESFKPDTFKPARFESDGKITLSGLIERSLPPLSTELRQAPHTSKN